MATIDNLVVEISANTNDIERKISNLSSALNSLKRASSINGAKLEGVADGFNAIKRACGGIKESTISKVERLATALERIGNANVGNISRALRNFESRASRTSADKTNRDFLPPALYDNSFKPPEVIKKLPALYDNSFKEVKAKMNEIVPWKSAGLTSSNMQDAREFYGSFRELGEVSEPLRDTGREAMFAWKNTNLLGKSLSSVFKIATDSAFTTMALPFKALKSAISAVLSPISSFIRSIGRIALYRAIRSAIKAVTAGIKEGLQNLAMFSKLRDEMDTHSANKTLSLYASNFLFLKNAIATAVIPVLKMLEPIIASVTNRMIDLINVFAQLFSFLSGSNTFTKAKYYYQDYADSLDKASGSAGKLNKQLAKFDELNNLTTNAGGGSGKATPDYLEMFEDPVPIADWIQNLKNMDFESFGKTISEKIKNSLDSINWTSIYEKSMKLGSGLAEFLNGLIQPDTFNSFGRTLAGGIMTAIKFAFSFGSTFDWKNLGESIAEGINGFFDEFDGGELADTINVWVQGIETTFKTAIKKIKWRSVFKDLFDFFRNIDIRTVGILLGSVFIYKGVNFAVNVAQAVVNGITTAIASKITNIALPTLTLTESGKASAMGLGSTIAGYALIGFASYIAGTRLTQLVGLIAGAITGDFSMYESGKELDPFSDILSKSPQMKIANAKGKAIGDVLVNSKAFQSAYGKGKFDKNSTFVQIGKAMGEEIVLGIVAGIGSKIKTFTSFPTLLSSVLEAMKTTFDSHSPAKKMYPIGEDIVLGIIEGFKLVNFKQKMQDWWNNEVVPWFTMNRWYGIAEGIRSGITAKWTETVNNWRTNISTWWNTNVSPWFTFEKWYGLASGIYNGITQKWNEIMAWFDSTFGFSGLLDKAKGILNESEFRAIGENIARGLYYPFEIAVEYMGQLFSAIKRYIEGGIALVVKVDTSQLKSAVEMASQLIDLGNRIANTALDEIGNNTITPDQIIDYGKRGDTTVIPAPTNNDDDPNKKKYVASRAGMPSHFASGGYPLQGSLFIAGESGAELVGNINGRTGVANTDQITDAMYQATYDAMSKALRENDNSGRLEVDGDGLFRFVRNRANEYFNSTGNPPFPA